MGNTAGCLFRVTLQEIIKMLYLREQSMSQKAETIKREKMEYAGMANISQPVCPQERSTP